MNTPLSQPSPPDRSSVAAIDDVTLAVRAQQGDLRSFEVLLRRHQQAMYRVALRVLGDPGDAEDAVQEAFVACWRSLDSYRGDAAFSSWLYRIVTNRCLTMIRSRRRHPTSPLDDSERTVAQPGASPERAAETDAEMAAVAGAVAALPVEQRICWVLRENDRLGYDEIAHIVGATPDAVRGRIHRARQTLARHMQAWQ